MATTFMPNLPPPTDHHQHPEAMTVTAAAAAAAPQPYPSASPATTIYSPPRKSSHSISALLNPEPPATTEPRSRYDTGADSPAYSDHRDSPPYDMDAQPTPGDLSNYTSVTGHTNRPSFRRFSEPSLPSSASANSAGPPSPDSKSSSPVAYEPTKHDPENPTTNEAEPQKENGVTTPAEAGSSTQQQQQEGTATGTTGAVVEAAAPKAKRKRITPEQLADLVALFEQTDTPSFEVREKLAKKLGMTNREIQMPIFA
ncbi:hypothetical protein BC938DRAFT_476227 [Jimgerdemannia flammicorona]|uniref:Homeobox domain-containing protein n=1 Tax=Jimgerdemannia flammicorona TaxID=994334 RepID=A0A433PIW3_9FUNG|nr:hypothetical protein BC938DRAFT_476227 [Jimgerdemannia flammicorona]